MPATYNMLDPVLDAGTITDAYSIVLTLKELTLMRHFYFIKNGKYFYRGMDKVLMSWSDE